MSLDGQCSSWAVGTTIEGTKIGLFQKAVNFFQSFFCVSILVCFFFCVCFFSGFPSFFWSQKNSTKIMIFTPIEAHYWSVQIEQMGHQCETKIDSIVFVDFLGEKAEGSL